MILGSVGAQLGSIGAQLGSVYALAGISTQDAWLAERDWIRARVTTITRRAQVRPRTIRAQVIPTTRDV